MSETATSSDAEDNGIDRLHVVDNGSEDELENDNSSIGILKKARSYENLRTPDRRVSFINEDELPTHSSGTSSSSSSGVNSPTKALDKVETGREESPDIQILSRSVIMPAQLSLGDSTDGEIGLSNDESSAASDYPTSLSPSKMDYGPAPPKPARRPIGPPMVHINSQSTDTDDNPNSPPPPPLPERNIHRTMAASPNIQNGSCEDVEDQMAEVTLRKFPGRVHDSTPRQANSSPSLMSEDIHASSVDLANFRYAAADIMFMKRLLSVQVGYQLFFLAILQALQMETYLFNSYCLFEKKAIFHCANVRDLGGQVAQSIERWTLGVEVQGLKSGDGVRFHLTSPI